ncbi:MAG: hypothetical protein ACRDTG_10930 [Pseudonocardiaceae bacterium]
MRSLNEKIVPLQRQRYSGTPLTEPDLRIASITLARGLILVTRNVRHFQRVPDLTFENWIDET